MPQHTSTRNTYITGLGVITAIGRSVAETLIAFEEHRSGIGAITRLITEHRDQLPVGEVNRSDLELARQLGLPKPVTRTALLGMVAAREAVEDSKVDLAAWRTGIISATTVGGMDRTENFFEQFAMNPRKGRLRDVVDHECGRTTELLAQDLGVSDYISTINTACSSSANSISYGARLIAAGLLDVVVAGGTDALTRFTLNGFNSLMILDKNYCRPFDESRAGLNLGEGAGFVVLVSEEVLKKTGVKSYCRVGGYANTTDAFHQTASSPEGHGNFLAMEEAIRNSGLLPQDIDYINMHGTGTQNNDGSEGAAVKRLFGDQIPPFSSTKSFTGHTLGASGGVEAVFSALAIHHGCLFPNLRFETAMAGTDLSPQKTFQRGRDIRHVLSNSFGFGGNCSSIVFLKN